MTIQSGLVAKIRVRKWALYLLRPVWCVQCALGFDPTIPKWAFHITVESA